MKQILLDIATAFEIPPSDKAGGIKKAHDEFEQHFKKTPLTNDQLTYLVSKSSPSQKKALELYDDLETSPRQQALFVEKGLREGLSKIVGSVYNALDFSSPTDWVDSIQQIHTLLSDVSDNARIIFNRADENQLPFYTGVIKAIEGLLPKLEAAMKEENIPIKSSYSQQGSEYFERLDSKDWQDLKSTATSRPHGLAGQDRKPPSRK